MTGAVDVFSLTTPMVLFKLPKDWKWNLTGSEDLA